MIREDFPFLWRLSYERRLPHECGSLLMYHIIFFFMLAIGFKQAVVAVISLINNTDAVSFLI